MPILPLRHPAAPRGVRAIARAVLGRFGRGRVGGGRLRGLGAAVALIGAGMALGSCGQGVQTGAGFGTVAGPTIDPAGVVAVALLVPSGSGRSGDLQIAAALENAARLAIADLGAVAQIELSIHPTAGTAASAAAAAQAAVDQGARLILGPVYAAEATAAGAAVADEGITVLSFSNNPSAAGGNVVVLGQTFAGTAERLARHLAATATGPVVLAHPLTEDGEAARAAVVAATGRARVALVATEPYAFSHEGVAAAVPRIAEQVRQSGARALILTDDSAGALPILSQMLLEAGVDPAMVRMVGLKRWDVPSETLRLPGIQGGWFALPDPDLTAAFGARYAEAYGRAPHPIAGLAYDGIAAVGGLIGQGRSDALTRAALGQGTGFAGVNGIFRILPDGTTERGLAVVEVATGRAEIVDPAPRSFAGAGL
ncbi:MAG: penicillin-binding protein activator [Gemmobacter sp.]